MLAYNIHLKQKLSASPSDVWRALTEPHLLEKWLMRNDFSAREGENFTFRSDPMPGWDGIVRGRVLEVVPNKKLSYQWKGAPDMPDTTVTWSLQPQNSGTELTFSHTGFRGLKYFLVGRMLKRGWKRMITQDLPKTLTAHVNAQNQNAQNQNAQNQPSAARPQEGSVGS